MDDHSTTKILIVEQQTDFRDFLLSQLELPGYCLLIAETADSALNMMQQDRPDLALADFHIAQHAQMRLLKEFLHLSPEFPTIILGKSETDHEASRFIGNGAWDYLPKSKENIAILRHSIKRGLERARLRRAENDHNMFLEQEVTHRTIELLHQNLTLENEIVQRKKQEELVQEAKKEWEQTFDALPDLIYITDREGRIKRMNRSLMNRLGISHEEALGKPFHLCDHHTSQETTDKCLHQQVLANGSEHTNEVYSVNLGGFFDLTVAPYYAANGRVVGTVHVARDINDRKNAEKDRDKFHTRLLHSQKLESVGQLAAGIAHEINTPTQFIASNMVFLNEAFQEAGGLLSDLTSYLQTSSKKGLSPESLQFLDKKVQAVDVRYLLEEIPEAIKQSREGINRIASIVQAMKEFSHPGNKEKKNYDLNRIIETAVTVSRNEWKYVATIQTDLDPMLGQVLCLSDEIGQVFLNILVNAAHAIESRIGKNPVGVKGVITISTKQHTHHVEIRMNDTGSGIPRECRGRIFDPFYTTKQVGKGTGQGLAIAHDVITQKHGGTITFETATEKGTTFIIRLPLAEDL